MKRTIKGALIMAMGMLCFGCSSAAGGGPGDSIEPVSPETVVAKRTAVFNYLSNLSYDNTFHGVVSGQNAYHGTELSDYGFNEMVKPLHDTSGEWIGVLGIDYEWKQAFTLDQLSRANKVLIDYAKANGIIQVTFTPQNPWVNDESDLAHNPGSWEDAYPSSTKSDMPNGASLNDLIDPNKTVNVAWMRKITRIGTALQELRDAGVIVLFRPIQEMNGNWFWWGIESHMSDPTPYKNVYRHLHDYFTNDLELNNLIWIYSPSHTGGEAGDNTASNAWVRTVDWAYPGDSYVDIVAGTSYTHDMAVVDYPVYLSFGKPLGMAEFSTSDYDMNNKIKWDNSKIITKIRDAYPRVGYWVSWHYNWSLIQNSNSKALLQNPWVINRGDLDWNITQPLLPATPVTEAGVSGTMKLRGSMNDGWGSTEMSGKFVEGDTVWSVTVTLAADTAYTFKFDANGDWSDSYGRDAAGAADAVQAGSADNFSYTTTSAGDYLFTFNKTDMTWSVTF